MAPPRRPWFRFYVEALHDRKLRSRPPAERWVWVAVLGMARSSPVPGSLLVAPGEPADLAVVADEANVPLAVARSAMSYFERVGMIALHDATWLVVKFNERQYESDSSSQRVARHRSSSGDATAMERSIAAPCNDDPLPMKRRSSRARATESEDREQKLLGDAPAAPRERQPDLLFEAVAEECGIDWRHLTRSARGALSKAVADLRSAGATPEEVPDRADAYRRLYERAVLTPPALAKHWPALSRAPRPSERSTGRAAGVPIPFGAPLGIVVEEV